MAVRGPRADLEVERIFVERYQAIADALELCRHDGMTLQVHASWCRIFEGDEESGTCSCEPLEFSPTTSLARVLAAIRETDH